MTPRVSDFPEVPDDAAVLPDRPIDPGWLDLREPADVRSRNLAAGVLLEPLLARWLNRPDHALRVPRVLRIVDLGAGTGANLRWLAPRLAALAPIAEQVWTLVDHDPRALSWAPAGARTVRADVADLSHLLSELGPTDLITAAALLDLLTAEQLNAVVEAVIKAQIPALFSLTVTGDVSLDPVDPLDDLLGAAFDAHQRREHRPGPDAGSAVAGLFRDHGWLVVQASTPWTLNSGQHPDLIGAWLQGRAEAAVEQRPELESDAVRWSERRQAQLDAGGLAVVVGHVDLLAVPA